MDFGIASVAAITVIAYLVGIGCKASEKTSDSWIPVICGCVGAALGFSAEDTAETIGLMANAGIKSSQAGISLRTIMTNLTGPITFVGESDISKLEGAIDTTRDLWFGNRFRVCTAF